MKKTPTSRHRSTIKGAKSKSNVVVKPFVFEYLDARCWLKKVVTDASIDELMKRMYEFYTDSKNIPTIREFCQSIGWLPGEWDKLIAARPDLKEYQQNMKAAFGEKHLLNASYKGASWAPIKFFIGSFGKEYEDLLENEAKYKKIEDLKGTGTLNVHMTTTPNSDEVKEIKKKK